MLQKLMLKIQCSIQFKILLLFSVSILIVHLVTWLLLSQFLFKAIEENQEAYLRNYAEKITKDIQDTKNDYENMVVQLAHNHEVAYRISKSYDNYMSVWETMNFIKSIMSSDDLLVHGIQKLQIVHNGEIGTDGEHFILLREDEAIPENLQWFEKEKDNRKYLCVAHKIKGLFNQVDAYVMLSVNAQKAFGTAMNSENGLWNFYLMDQEDKVIASSQNNVVGDYVEAHFGQRFDYSNEDIFLLKEQNCIGVQYPVGAGWKVIVTLPINEYANNIKNAKLLAFLILLIYLAGMEFILNMTLKEMFARINKIGRRIEKVSVSEDRLIDVNGCDEIAKLEIQYNLMLKNLDTTISELADVRNQKQLIEIKSLESHINPHFLYNTLGVIRWEALESENKKICEMVDKLSLFYRLSLNKGKGTLTVRNEIELAKAYLYIQQMRCDYMILVEIQVDEALLDIEIPKMMLQPLLENIFIHGNIVEPGRRKIFVTFRKIKEKMSIEVKDNGKGMNEETVTKLNSKKEAFSLKRGVGISFIHEVLRIYYGEHGKLKVESILGEGTRVQIELPLEGGKVG